MSQMISDGQLDRAHRGGRLTLGARNKRPVKCARYLCAHFCAKGCARKVFIDGHYRGFLCAADCAGLAGDNARLAL